VGLGLYRDKRLASGEAPRLALRVGKLFDKTYCHRSRFPPPTLWFGATTAGRAERPAPLPRGGKWH